MLSRPTGGPLPPGLFTLPSVVPERHGGSSQSTGIAEPTSDRDEAGSSSGSRERRTVTFAHDMDHFRLAEKERRRAVRIELIHQTLNELERQRESVTQADSMASPSSGAAEDAAATPTLHAPRAGINLQLSPCALKPRVPIVESQGCSVPHFR